MKKLVAVLLIAWFFLTGIEVKAFAWENICPDETASSYCAKVGKDAYNRFGAQVLRTVKLGEIIGVCWRPKGSLISKDGRVSPRNAYYYIIDDGWGPDKAFIRQCREILEKWI